MNRQDIVYAEAERVAKYLNQKENKEFVDYFISSLIINLELGYFETLGLCEHIKSEYIRITNEVMKDEE